MYPKTCEEVSSTTGDNGGTPCVCGHSWLYTTKVTEACKRTPASLKGLVLSRFDAPAT